MLGHPYRKYCNHLNQIKSGLNGCNIFKPFEVFQYKLFKPAPDCLSQICIDLLLQQDGAWSKPQRLQAFCYGIHNMDHTQQYNLDYTQFFYSIHLSHNQFF